MLNYKERAVKNLRLLQSEFSEFIDRIIEHSDTTPGLISSNLLAKVSDLITDIESEKSEVSRKIIEYFNSINRDLKNEQYFLEVIEALDISDNLKSQCRDMLKRQIFTEEQFKIFLGMIREVEKDQKERTMVPEQSEEEILEQFHSHIQSKLSR
jgi:hypothetical protein